MRVYRGLDSLPDIQKSVVTIGSFDGLHIGHQKIINRVKQISSELACENYIITFDPHPRSVIYPRDKSLQLLTTLEEKIELFEKYGVDNLVIIPFTIEFSQISALEYMEKFLIGNFKPDYIVIGYDHRFGINRSGDINLLKQVRSSYGFEIIEIEAQEVDEITISSTKIRSALQSGDLEQANGLLNHAYPLSGIVVRGRKLGTEIGFPTANIKLEDDKKLIPMDGIYACRVIAHKKTHNGMLYIGDIPTIGMENRKSIEVNIFDFNDDIYGQRLSLQVLKFLRHEQKFESIEDLRLQLHKDRDQALDYFNDLEAEKQALVSVAILNYNTKHYLEEFLPSVSYSSKEEFETVLIDNGSTDSSVKYVSDWFPEVKLIEFSKNYGFAEAYNRALGQIHSKYVAILNSDVMVTEDWLDPLVNFLEDHPDYAAVMPKILSLEDKEYFEYAGASGGYIDSLAYPFCRGRIFDHIEKDTGQYDTPQDIFWASGAALLIRKDLFISLLGFDKDFFAHQEEIDLCWRISNAGYSIAVIPESYVYHLGGGTLDYSDVRKVYLNFRNSLFTLFKNDQALSLIWKIPARLILDGIAGIRFVLLGKFKSCLAIIEAHFSFYRNFFHLMKKRMDVKKAVEEYAIAAPQIKGKLKSSIIFYYYILGRRNFSQIFNKS